MAKYTYTSEYLRADYELVQKDFDKIFRKALDGQLMFITEPIANTELYINVYNDDGDEVYFELRAGDNEWNYSVPDYDVEEELNYSGTASTLTDVAKLIAHDCDDYFSQLY